MVYPLTQINKTHTAIANTDIDTYTVSTTTTSTSSSNQGGNEWLQLKMQ